MLIVVNNGTYFLAEIEEALTGLDLRYEVVAGYELVTPQMLDSYSGVVLTGGEVHVFEEEELAGVALHEQILGSSTIPCLESA